MILAFGAQICLDELLGIAHSNLIPGTMALLSGETTHEENPLQPNWVNMEKPVQLELVRSESGKQQAGRAAAEPSHAAGIKLLPQSALQIEESLQSYKSKMLSVEMPKYSFPANPKEVRWL